MLQYYSLWVLPSVCPCITLEPLNIGRTLYMYMYTWEHVNCGEVVIFKVYQR